MAHLSDDAVWRYSAGLCAEAEAVEVRRHLETCQDCAARLEADTGGSGAAGSESREGASAAPAPETPLERGATLGRYLVLQVVGQGGMGVVYAAYDPELNRKVALKLLRVRPERATPQQGQQRLLREAQAMARVSHPNVIGVYDVGTLGDRVFVAMEFVEGVTLKHWLAQAKRSWREVLDVFVAAGRGLAAAHAAGLVHRDFKPDNVLVGHDGRPRVTDFGLARLTSTDEPGPSADPAHAPALLNSHVTQDGKVVGTPFYMAPEQHRGVTPDGRSDQFSFCAALYFALYGKRPFDPVRLRREMAQSKPALTPAGIPAVQLPASGASAPSTTASQPKAASAKDEPLIHEPPLDARVPRSVRRAILRGLSLSPERRFASMEELLARLSQPPGRALRGWAAVAGLATLAAIGFTWRGWADRRAALCSGASSKLEKVWDAGVRRDVERAFLATGKPYAADTFAGVRDVLDRYAQRWATQHTDACQATRVRGEQSEAMLSLRMICLDQRLARLEALTGQLAQADEAALDRAVDAVNALPDLSACADLEALSATVRPPESPSAQVELSLLHSKVAQARALYDSGRYAAGLQVARSAVEDARKLGYAPVLAEALTVQGWLRDHAGDLKGAEQSLMEAVSVAEAGRNDEAKVIAESGLVLVVGERQARPVEGHLWATLAHAALARLGGHEDLAVNLGLSEGNMLAGEGRYRDALAIYQQALERARRALPSEHPYLAALQENIGTTQAALGDRPAAIKALETAIALNERLRGKGHPVSASSHDHLSSVLLEEGDFAKALSHAQKALAIWQATLPATHRDLAAAHNNVGSALAALGRFDEALEHQRRALAIKEKALPKDHPGLSYPLDGIGAAYLGLGRPVDAVPVLERALELKNPDPTLTAHTRFHLARALAQLGRPRDRERIRSLAEQAREGFQAMGKKTDAAEVERFREHLPR